MAKTAKIYEQHGWFKIIVAKDKESVVGVLALVGVILAAVTLPFLLPLLIPLFIVWLFCCLVRKSKK